MLKLKLLRLSKGYTQRQLAKILNISPDHLSSIETGRRWPSGKVIIRLERFFGIPASELLAESKEQQLIAK